MKIKSFECPKSIRNYEKKNTWNVRRLVDESFVTSAQRTSVVYCRLSDFRLRIDSCLKGSLSEASSSLLSSSSSVSFVFPDMIFYRISILKGKKYQFQLCNLPIQIGISIFYVDLKTAFMNMHHTLSVYGFRWQKTSHF